jgi:hypothetical protein
LACAENINNLEALPSEANRGLMKALVAVASSCEDQASRELYYDRVVKPLCDKYNALICRHDLKKIFTEDKLRNQVSFYFFLKLKTIAQFFFFKCTNVIKLPNCLMAYNTWKYLKSPEITWNGQKQPILPTIAKKGQNLPKIIQTRQKSLEIAQKLALDSLFLCFNIFLHFFFIRSSALSSLSSVWYKVLTWPPLTPSTRLSNPFWPLWST